MFMLKYIQFHKYNKHRKVHTMHDIPQDDGSHLQDDGQDSTDKELQDLIEDYQTLMSPEYIVGSERYKAATKLVDSTAEGIVSPLYSHDIDHDQDALQEAFDEETEANIEDGISEGEALYHAVRTVFGWALREEDIKEQITKYVVAQDSGKYHDIYKKALGKYVDKKAPGGQEEDWAEVVDQLLPGESFESNDEADQLLSRVSGFQIAEKGRWEIYNDLLAVMSPYDNGNEHTATSSEGIEAVRLAYPTASSLVRANYPGAKAQNDELLESIYAGGHISEDMKKKIREKLVDLFEDS